MTYIVTPNSVPLPLNDQGSTKFITQNIQDPAVQQNFEILNKLLNSKLSGKQVEPANIVFGPALGSASTMTTLSISATVSTVPSLQLQISSRGNPIRIKLAPFVYNTTNAIPSASAFQVIGTNSGSPSAVCGWLRKSSLANTFTTISSVSLFAVATPVDFGSFTELLFSVPLPAFEMDDVVPSGTYTYQFYYYLGTGTIKFINVQAVAYEMR